MSPETPKAIEIRKKIELAQQRARRLSDRLDRGMARILYDDVPTFMEAPFFADARDSDMVVVGFPYEGVKVYSPSMVVPPLARRKDPAIYARAGACDAPAAIRRNSIHYSLEHSPGGYFPELGRDYRIADWVTVADAGDLPADPAIPSEQVLKGASDVLHDMLGATQIPILLGGDDTVPYVGVRAVARHRKGRIAVIKFDSHYDLAREPRFWAGSQWIPLMEEGFIEPTSLALVGIRGLRNRTMLHEIATELEIPYWTLDDIDHRGIEAVVAEAVAKVAASADYIYISLDLDVIDPAFLPAQKYPEPAGLTAREIVRALRRAVADGPPLCGFDMACLGPDYDLNGLGAQLAARCAVEVIGSFGYRRYLAGTTKSTPTP